MDWFARRQGLEFELEEGLVGGISYDQHGTPLDRCGHGAGAGRGRGAVRRGRRAQVRRAAVRSEARARPLAPAEGARPVREPPAGQGVRCARRQLLAQARAGQGPRPDDPARAHRRDLLRRAARHRDPARRPAPRRQHPGLHDQRDRPGRAGRLRARAQARQPGLLGREGERHGERRALARGGAEAARRRVPGRRAQPHVRRQLRDAAGPPAQAVRRDRDRQSVRRPALGLSPRC